MIWHNRQPTLRAYCPNRYTLLLGCLSCTVLDEPIIGPNFTHLNEGENVLNIFLGSVNVSDVMNRYRSSKYEKSWYIFLKSIYFYTILWLTFDVRLELVKAFRCFSNFCLGYNCFVNTLSRCQNYSSKLFFLFLLGCTSRAASWYY